MVKPMFLIFDSCHGPGKALVLVLFQALTKSESEPESEQPHQLFFLPVKLYNNQQLQVLWKLIDRMNGQGTIDTDSTAVCEEEMGNNLKLIRPTHQYAEQVMRFREEMLANNDTLDGCAGLEEVRSFDEWIDFENRLKQKYGEGYVPSEVFLAVRDADDKVVGIALYDDG